MKKLNNSSHREQRKRQKSINNRTWYISSDVRQRMRDNDQRDLTHVDPSFLSLQTIPHIPQYIERSTKSRHNPSTSRLKHQQRRSRYGGLLLCRPDKEVPKYDSWIPVLVNYWVGKDLHLEPYMPFLGDQENECEAAFEVYEDMAGDAGKDMELSDGELNESGKFIAPRQEGERIKYYSMAQTRRRQAIRKAILAVLDRDKKDKQSHSKKTDEQVWDLLTQALGLRNIKRVKAIARVAEERRIENEEIKNRREYDNIVQLDMKAVWSEPPEESLQGGEEQSASANVLKHFCFTCHTIPCAQHAGMDVEPVLPIEDEYALAREEAIRKKTTNACSHACGLRHVKKKSTFIGRRRIFNDDDDDKDDDDNDDRRKNKEILKKKRLEEESIDLTSDSKWSPEEILLLRDAVTIFGMDPCSLAVVIGSRTCSEVALRLEDPLEADILHCELRKARSARRTLGDKRRTQYKGAKKDVVLGYEGPKIVDFNSDGGNAIDQDFEPCEHGGACSVENNCSCVKKGLHCETTCGCNSGRYVQEGATGGIVWMASSKEKSIICKNRHYGCSCKTGTCTESTCPCWENYRACNPDFCECDVTCLPQHISIQKRQCKNWPIILGKHKKTFIGTSSIHGFGLFAGERFDNGDLVGIYSGQLIDTRLADMIGRIYDATNRTYIFNMTESLVIDGGLLGSKAKFCNHTKPGSKENCGSRLVRVRGDAYVALFAKRSVNPGEEFLFDYRFTGEVPAWAKDDKNKNK